jgi:hypothetical protein
MLSTQSRYRRQQAFYLELRHEINDVEGWIYADDIQYGSKDLVKTTVPC